MNTNLMVQKARNVVEERLNKSLEVFADDLSKCTSDYVLSEVKPFAETLYYLDMLFAQHTIDALLNQNASFEEMADFVEKDLEHVKKIKEQSTTLSFGIGGK